MLKALMLVSGWIEILFGLWALFGPLLVVEAVGGTPTLTLIRLLGAATFGLGVGALVGRNHLETQGGLAAAYGLGLYNVLGAAALLLGAATAGSPGLWGGAVLHSVIGLLFVYAFVDPR
jgi:hypothetical protein